MRIALALSLLVAAAPVPVIDAAPAFAQTSTKAARPAKKPKAAARRPPVQRETPPDQRASPAPVRDPLVDRSTGSAY